MSFIYYVLFALFYGRIVKNKNIKNDDKTLEIKSIETNEETKNNEDANNISLDSQNKEDNK